MTFIPFVLPFHYFLILFNNKNFPIWYKFQICKYLDIDHGAVFFEQSSDIIQFTIPWNVLSNKSVLWFLFILYCCRCRLSLGHRAADRSLYQRHKLCIWVCGARVERESGCRGSEEEGGGRCCSNGGFEEGRGELKERQCHCAMKQNQNSSISIELKGQIRQSQRGFCIYFCFCVSFFFMVIDLTCRESIEDKRWIDIVTQCCLLRLNQAFFFFLKERTYTGL